MAREISPTPPGPKQPLHISYPSLTPPEHPISNQLTHLPEGLVGNETLYGDGNVVVLTGSGTPKNLRKEISTLLGLTDLENPNSRFPNGEEKVVISPTVKGKTVFILQSATFPEPAHGKMEVKAMADAAKFAGAKHIVNINFHDPYSRAERHYPIGHHALGVVNTKSLADAGVDTIVDFNIHSATLMEATKDTIKWENIDAFPQLTAKLTEYLGNDTLNVVFVSPDKGGEARTREYANHFQLPMITAHKTRKYDGDGSVDTIQILGNEQEQTDGTKSKITDKRTHAIIIDDMVDTAGTLVKLVNELQNEGIQKCTVVASHAICSGQAVDRLLNAHAITKIIFSNSLPIDERLLAKTDVVSLAQPTVDFMKDYMQKLKQEEKEVTEQVI